MAIGDDGSGKLPDKATLIVTTGHVKTTIILKPGKGDNYDTQITIKDGDEESRDAAIDAEVERRIKERDVALREREAKLEERAALRADELVLEGLATEGLERRGAGGDGRAASDDGVVLIARGAVRIGDRRYFLIAIDNQSGRPFEVKAVKLFQSDGKNSRPVKITWRFADTVVQPDDTIEGAIWVPVKKAPAGGVRFKVRVEESSGGRAVDLGGMSLF